MALGVLSRYSNFGILMLRFAAGFYLIVDGAPKVFEGPDTWVKIGNSLAVIGVKLAPELWGFLTVFSEFVCGFLMILGLKFRASCLLLFIISLIASIVKFNNARDFIYAPFIYQVTILFLSMAFIGAGDYSIDKDS